MLGFECLYVMVTVFIYYLLFCVYMCDQQWDIIAV